MGIGAREGAGHLPYDDECRAISRPQPTSGHSALDFQSGAEPAEHPKIVSAMHGNGVALWQSDYNIFQHWIASLRVVVEALFPYVCQAIFSKTRDNAVEPWQVAFPELRFHARAK
jgi:hypothetical protein